MRKGWMGKQTVGGKSKNEGKSEKLSGKNKETGVALRGKTGVRSIRDTEEHTHVIS
jgi:hypothetical protein